MHVQSFKAIADASSRVLVVGSMPGKVSLKAGQYYAHPRNLFWKIIESQFGIGPASPYETRITQLLAARVALWDVLKSCNPSALRNPCHLSDSDLENRRR